LKTPKRPFEGHSNLIKLPTFFLRLTDINLKGDSDLETSMSYFELPESFEGMIFVLLHKLKNI
jgi:hypothetical protein